MSISQLVGVLSRLCYTNGVCSIQCLMVYTGECEWVPCNRESQPPRTPAAAATTPVRHPLRTGGPPEETAGRQRFPQHPHRGIRTRVSG